MVALLWLQMAPAPAESMLLLQKSPWMLMLLLLQAMVMMQLRMWEMQGMAAGAVRLRMMSCRMKSCGPSPGAQRMTHWQHMT